MMSVACPDVTIQNIPQIQVIIIIGSIGTMFMVCITCALKCYEYALRIRELRLRKLSRLE